MSTVLERIQMVTRHAERVKCTYKDCQKEFESTQDMVKHKIDDPLHDYCPTCPRKDMQGNDIKDKNGKVLRGVDCKDWKDFIKHKVQSDKHLCCPECGLDFKSHGGLKRHVNLAHPAKQHIHCKGCPKMFDRASHLVNHLEHGFCKSMTKDEFQVQVCRNAIIRPLFDQHNPELSFSTASTKHVKTTEVSTTTTHHPSTAGTSHRERRHLSNSTNRSDDQEGGVSLLDSIADLELNLPLPLSAEKKSTLTSPSSNGTVMHSTTLKIDPGAGNNLFHLGSPYFEKGLQVLKDEYNEKYPEPASIVRIGEAKANVQAPSLRVPLTSSQSVDILHQQYWESNQIKHNPEFFFNPVIDKYECRFPQCAHTVDTQASLSSHNRTKHPIREYQCPSCKRLFDSVTAIIAHMETSSIRCNIRDSADFAEIVIRLSGGFLSVQQLRSYRDFETGEMVEDRPQVVRAGFSNGQREDVTLVSKTNDISYHAAKPAGFW